MSAITIRALPESTHEKLRQRAAAIGQSLESMVRETLAALAAQENKMDQTLTQAGFAEKPLPWPQPGMATFDSLWGAMAGMIHVPSDTDLTAPTGEDWDAEAGRI
jgi:plasmid stability protein